MGRLRLAYTLFKRAGSPCWYYQTYDQHGGRTIAKSTGKTSKTEAHTMCDTLFQQGLLLAKRVPTLQEWVDERHWFIWDECLYTKGKLARSTPEQPGISRGYVDKCRTYLDTYILPYFGSQKLDAIEPPELENWLFMLDEKGLSHKSINNIAVAFRTITKEATRLDVIREDPWIKVSMFAASMKKKGALATQEAKQLMHPATMREIWKDRELYYYANLTCMLTGMRIGEVLALRKEDIFPDHISVNGSWQREYKTRGTVKTKRNRIIAIPLYLYNALTAFAVWDGYIFSFNGGESPATSINVLKAFYEALEHIGITKQEAKDRRITVHSWRVWNNTYLRAKNVPDAIVRSQTGHTTEEMTDHYTNFDIKELAPVQQAQDAMVSLLQSPQT